MATFSLQTKVRTKINGNQRDTHKYTHKKKQEEQQRKQHQYDELNWRIDEDLIVSTPTYTIICGLIKFSTQTKYNNNKTTAHIALQTSICF